MKLLFHQPKHPEQPLHGARYYFLLAAGLLLLGVAYTLWAL